MCVDAATPLVTESGQSAAWTSLNEDWAGYVPEDASRIRRYARWLRDFSPWFARALRTPFLPQIVGGTLSSRIPLTCWQYHLPAISSHMPS